MFSGYGSLQRARAGLAEMLLLEPVDREPVAHLGTQGRRRESLDGFPHTWAEPGVVLNRTMSGLAASHAASPGREALNIPVRDA